MDIFLRPELCLPLATKDHLRAILDRAFVIVQASAHALHETLGPEIVARPGYRTALIETAVVMNAVLGAYTVQQGLTSHGEKKFGVLYGVYLGDASNLGSAARWFRLVSSGCRTERS